MLMRNVKKLKCGRFSQLCDAVGITHDSDRICHWHNGTGNCQPVSGDTKIVNSKKSN